MNPLPKTTEALDNAAPALIEWLQQAAAKGADALSTQAPLLAEEVIRLGLVRSAFGIGLALLLFLLALLCVHFFRKYAKLEAEQKRNRYAPDYEVPIVFSFIGTILFAASSVFLFSHSTYNLVSILAAPRLYLIQEVARLLQ